MLIRFIFTISIKKLSNFSKMCHIVIIINNFLFILHYLSYKNKVIINKYINIM